MVYAQHRPWWRVLLLGVLILLMIPLASADPVKKATDLAVFQPIEIPGMVLQVGNYVMKVPDPVTHPDMVGFYNEDESQLIKLVRTIPKYRLEPTDKTLITFEERAHGAPDAIKGWFYPGDYWGKEFVYGNAKTLTVAEAAPAPALLPTPAPVEETVAPAPQPAAAPVVETPAPVEVAKEAPPAPPAEAAPAVAPEAVAVQELPKTGSSLPLVALLGTFSLGLGLVLRSVPERTRNGR